MTHATTPINATQTARIHQLWDELAEFDVTRHDEALEHLLRTLCDLAGAQNASWFGAVRLAEVSDDDALNGWRPRLHRFLHRNPQLDASVRQLTALIEQQKIDISLAQRVANAGRLRVERLTNIVPAGWFESGYYHHFFLEHGHIDALVAGCPVNDDTEIHFTLFRAIGTTPFTADERNTIHEALRSLRWFHRQYLLSHGLLAATVPLTTVEREVLRGLLSGIPEKEIAAAQGRSAHTTHEYVKSIYRKFGVSSRAALMALWIGKLP